MKSVFERPQVPWLVSAGVAALLLLATLSFPLWRLELVAPQYPAGLVMYAYGYKFAEDSGSYYDDIKEINGLNHYIGMKPIEEVTEMRLFIPGVIALATAAVLSTVIAWRRRLVRGIIIAGFWFMPLFFVADLQYWLYHYGHSLDEGAALNTGAFTPKVFGTTKVWNFHSVTRFEIGFYLMIAAALAVTFGPMLISRLSRLRHRRWPSRAGEGGLTSGSRIAIVLLAATMIAIAGAVHAGAGPTHAQPALSIQDQIDRAVAEDIIVVPPGEYNERIVIDKPISLVGQDWPVIDGGGAGDVITITADDVVVSGLVVRGSGRSVSREPAGIKVADADRVKITSNRIAESHFGVYVTNSRESIIRENEIDGGRGVPQERRGHAIYLWKVHDSNVHRNTIRYAADGIHLEFADDNLVVENSVSESRYALHLMYAHRNSIVRNSLRDNLSGAVLMFSHELIVKDNDLSWNRKGATGAGMLLKDTDNIYVEGNRILRNKYGLTAEGAPESAGATAIFRTNLIALNDVGLTLASNSPITFVENAVIDNFVQIRASGGALTAGALAGHGGSSPSSAIDGASPARLAGAAWSSDGRGNYWSDYRGYDADGDGVGDHPYLPRPAFAGRLAANETLQAFQFTLAQQALDSAADLFPVYRYDAVIEDAHPLMSPPPGTALERSAGGNAPLLAASLAMTAAAALAIIVVRAADLRRVYERAGIASRPRGRYAPP